MAPIVVTLIAVAALAVAAPAGAHRDPCHQAYECPSDHASYRWKGLLCVRPDSDARDSSFLRRVRHAGLTYYCKGTATPAPATGATSGFHTPQWAAQCVVEAHGKPGDTTLLCWTPNDGFYVRMTPMGTVTKGYAQRFRGYRDTRRAGRLRSFGQDWYHRSPGFNQYGCQSRSTGLTCGNHESHGWWLGRYKGYRIF